MKIFASLLIMFLLLVFSGCAYRFDYKEAYMEKLPIEEKITPQDIKNHICFFYDANAFVKPSFFNHFTHGWVYDYGESMQTIGDVYFKEYENIHFIDERNISSAVGKCQVIIFTSMSNATYGYPRDVSMQGEIQSDITFQVFGPNHLGFEKTYKSGPIVVQLHIPNIFEYETISTVFGEWIRDRIIDIIIEANLMSEQRDNP